MRLTQVAVIVTVLLAACVAVTVSDDGSEVRDLGSDAGEDMDVVPSSTGGMPPHGMLRPNPQCWVDGCGGPLPDTTVSPARDPLR